MFDWLLVAPFTGNRTLTPAPVGIVGCRVVGFGAAGFGNLILAPAAESVLPLLRMGF